MLASRARRPDFFNILDWIEMHVRHVDSAARVIAYLSALARLAPVDPDAAWHRWKDFGSGESIQWTPRVVETGKGFFAHLSPGRVEEIANDIQSPSAKAALFVVIMEEKDSDRVDENALAAIESIYGDMDQLVVMTILPFSTLLRRAVHPPVYFHPTSTMAEIRGFSGPQRERSCKEGKTKSVKLNHFLS